MDEYNGLGVRRRASLAGLVAAPAIGLLLAAVALAAQTSVKLKRVSSDPYVNTGSFHATEVEADTFSFKKRIVATFQVGRFFNGGASNIGWATSADGGRTWRHGFLPSTTRFATPRGKFQRASDPSVVFDAKHKTWLIAGLPLTARPAGPGIFVNRSTDGGIQWSAPVIVAYSTASQGFDKPWIACDNSPASPHYGSCYVQWDDALHQSQLFMSYSRDGGRKWTSSVVPTAGAAGGQPLVAPDGRVVVPAMSGDGRSIESFVSTDGGLTYTGPAHVGALRNHADAGDLRSPALPTAAIDGAGRVYVAWADCRFRPSCAANDIVFSSSTDGTHWSAVRRIPIDRATSGVDHVLPGLGAAANTSGAKAKLALTYYYLRTHCTVATCRLDVGYVHSSDGGAHWSAPIRLAGPTKIRELPRTNSGYMVGDYLSTSVLTGIAGDPALSVFAVGLRVAGKTCTLGQLTSCDVPMKAPSSGLPTAGAASRRAVTGPVRSVRSDHALSPPLPLR